MCECQIIFALTFFAFQARFLAPRGQKPKQGLVQICTGPFAYAEKYRGRGISPSAGGSLCIVDIKLLFHLQL